MTMREFVVKVAQLALQQERRVFAVDFAPAKEGIQLTFRFKDDE